MDRDARLCCRHALPLLLLLFAALFYFSPVLTADGIFAGSDIHRQFFFWHSFARAELLDGRFPLWDPYTFGGRPFFAALQPALLYPLTWLYLLPSYPLALHLNLLLNLALAGFFAYLYVARATGDRVAGLVAGITYAFSGFALTCLFLGHVTISNCLPWLPLLFLALDLAVRQPAAGAALLAAGFALLLFAGQPQFAFYAGVTAALYTVARALVLPQRGRFLLAAAAGAALGLLLASAQLLPTLELNARSARRLVPMAWEQVVYQSLVPLHLPQFIVPGIFGTIPDGTYFWQLTGYEEVMEYAGLPALLLAGIGWLAGAGRRRHFFTALAGAALLAACGQHLPCYRWLHEYVPGFALFRWPLRLLWLWSFAVAVLAGLGLARLRDGRLSAAAAARTRRATLVLLCLSLAAALALAAAAAQQSTLAGALIARAQQAYDARGTQHARPFAWYAEKIPVVLGAALTAAARSAFVLLAGSILLALMLRQPRLVRWCSYALTLLLFADLWSVARPYLVTRAVPDRAALAALVPEGVREGETRYLSLAQVLPQNSGMLIRREELGGYDPLLTADWYRLAERHDRNGRVDENAPLQDPDLAAPAWRYLGLAAVLHDSGWQEFPAAARYVPADKVALLRFVPGDLTLDIADGTRDVLVRQPWYPGWQAGALTASGPRPAAVAPAPDRSGLTVVRLLLPEGTRRVRLTYHPPLFRAGLALTLLGTLLLLWLLLTARRQRA